MQQRRTLHTLLSSPPLSSGWRDRAALIATTSEPLPRLLLSLSLFSISPTKPRHQPPDSPILLSSLFFLFRWWIHRQTTSRTSFVDEIDNNNKMAVDVCRFGQRATARSSQLQVSPPLLSF